MHIARRRISLMSALDLLRSVIRALILKEGQEKKRKRQRGVWRRNVDGTDMRLVDDPCVSDESSVLVPDDIKDKIRAYLDAMRL